MVAGRIGEALPNVKVALGSQYRLVPKGQLDLFERRMAAMRQFRKCATQIMGSEFDPQFLGMAPNNKVDGLRAQALAEVAVLCDGAKQSSIPYVGGKGPSVETVLRPCGHRDVPDAITFSLYIDDHPSPFAFLYPITREARDFAPMEAAAYQQG